MRKGLEDEKYELIKAHILNPADSPLNPQQQEQLNRILSMAGTLDRYPIAKHAVAIHMKKYKGLKRTQAYDDCDIARRLFPTIHNNYYEFWQTWLINDISESIRRCKNYHNVKAERVIAALYNVMAKAIGEKPPKDIDPKLMEQHNFILTININGLPTNVNLMEFLDLPKTARKKLTDALITDIDEEDAEKIIES
ncbi:MAG TPA: hypothetical protein PL124_05355 [Candidatus Cloacimonadota bacterium]|nr:hypothetical protein [Candidatus Cloacimonadota bacterium]HPS38823.1 hypothetical protein [Candidatus Cloacimonadota bacterium]